MRRRLEGWTGWLRKAQATSRAAVYVFFFRQKFLQKSFSTLFPNVWGPKVSKGKGGHSRQWRLWYARLSQPKRAAERRDD